MIRHRPAGVLVMAILLLIFGSLGLLGSLCGGAITLAGGAKTFTVQPPPGAKPPPDADSMMKARIPYYATYQAVGLVLGMVAGGVMILCGLGLLGMRPGRGGWPSGTRVTTPSPPSPTLSSPLPWSCPSPRR